jgi:multiple sugar transport system permease protein
VAGLRSPKTRARAHALTGALVAAVFAAPLVVMISGSIRRPGLGPPRSLELIPDPVTAEGYRQAFRLAPLARAMGNSLFVAGISVPIAILTASLAGFAIAQMPPHRRRRLIAVVLLLLMVPVTALWLARFAMFKAAGLIDTPWPLVAPALMGGSPFAVLLYVYAFRRVPSEVYDAARLEGASGLAIWRRVAMPLVRATTVAVGMLAFLAAWANFIDPLLYLNTESKYTAPLALRYLQQLGPTNWPVLLAGSAIVTAPVVVMFLLAQRRFLQEERGIGWLGR